MLLGPRMKLFALKWYALARTRYLKARFAHRFPSIYIGKDVQIIGVEDCAFGSNVTISQGTWINVNHRDGQEPKKFSCGNNCYIGKNNFFTVGQSIELHDYFFSSLDCKLLCASHEINPSRPYLAQTVDNTKRIVVEANVFMGAGASIIGNVRIGYGCVIGGGTTVTRDIPPLSVVVGSPCRIIKRYSFRERTWVNPREAEESMYPNEVEYLQTLKPVEAEICKFLYAAERTNWC